MAPRASWKGHLKLSLVSCPVRVYNATSKASRITLNNLHKDTHNRIQMKPYDPELGLVERSDLVKGYEYEKSHYVIIEPEDIEQLGAVSDHTLTIDEMPGHDHNVDEWRANDFDSTGGSKFTMADTNGSQNLNVNKGMHARGGDQPHNNMPPWIALNLIVKF